MNTSKNSSSTARSAKPKNGSDERGKPATSGKAKSTGKRPRAASENPKESRPQRSARSTASMDALAFLEQQHRHFDTLFAEIEKAKGENKREIFEELADGLSMHTTIEEEVFYPGVKHADTESMLTEAADKHLQAKRLLADLLASSDMNATFDAKLKVLKDEIEHHVEEEEDELFPLVSKLFDVRALRDLSAEMQALQKELLTMDAPRERVTEETNRATQF